MRTKRVIEPIIFLLALVLFATMASAMPYFNGVVVYTNPYNYSATNASLITSFFVFDNTTVANVSCHLDSQIYQAQSTGVNQYQCNMISPLTQGNFNVVYNATNINNETNFTSASFSTIPSTTGSLTFTPNGQYVMNMTYNSQETRLINATLTNTGSAPMFDARINITRFENNFAATTAMSQSCGTIPIGQSCTKTFDINIPANTQSQVYHVYFNADWTNPDTITPDNVFEINTWIRVVYNPEVSYVPELNITATPTQLNQIITGVVSIGNVPLSAVNVTYAGGSLPQSWLTISPNYFAQINAGEGRTYQINITPPAGTAIGLYTAYLNITSNDNPKTQTVNVNVGPYYGWNSSLSQALAYNRLQISGTLTQLTINNTGNVGQDFQITYSGTVYSNGYLTDPSPAIISLNPGQTQTLNINYNNFISVDGNYNLNIQVQNLNTSTTQNHQAQLIAESTAPSVTIVSPNNNSAISGLTNLQVTASDTLAGMQKVEFYVDSVLRGTDNDTTDSTFLYSWNTSLLPDKLITIEARAYDQIGNTNTKTWYAYNQNPVNSLPYVNSSIPDLVIQEDTSTSFPIDIVFNDNDYGEILTYSFSGNDNITIVVGGGIAYVIPDPDFYGFRTVTATATDTQGANVSDIFNIQVINVQDIPTTPFINAPMNGSVISSATGTVNFQWTASFDPDPEPLTYRLFLGTGTPQLYQITANTQLTATGLAPGNYNWYLLVYDEITTVQTSTYSFQLLPNAYPVIDSYTPTSAIVNVIKNNTQNFTVSVTEPDNETLTHNWTLDGNQVSASNNYTFDSTNQPLGVKQLVYTASDPNQNTASRSWTIQVSEQNQAPVLTQNFSYVEIPGGQTANINLNNYFSDPNTADILAFSASQTEDIIFSFNNGIVTITPINDFFGIRMVTFSATDGTSTAYSNPVLVIVRKNNHQPEVDQRYPKSDEIKTSASQNLQFSVEVSDPEEDPVSIYWYVNNELRQSEVKSKYNLKEYPLQYISNGQFNGKIVVGEKGTIKETQAANSILSTLESYTFEGNDVYTDEEIARSSSSSNLIVLGTPQHNHLVDELLGRAGYKTEFAPGEALIKSVDFNSHIAIVITGYSDEDVLEAVGYFNEFETRSLGTDEVRINTNQNTLEFEASYQSSLEYYFREGNYEVKVEIIDGNGATENFNWYIETMGRPSASTFDGSSTDFEDLTEEELNHVQLILEKTNYGLIEFDNLLNLSYFIDFDRYVEIGPSYIAIDTNAVPELAGQPATITLYNIVLSNPVIFYTSGFTSNPDNANSICTNCQIISYENNVLTFHVSSFSSYFVKETQAASISLPEEIQLGSDHVLRGQNITSTFTISNPGNEEDIEDITVKTTASSKYMIQFSTDGTNYASEIKIDLDAGDSETIYLKGYIPTREAGGQHSIGKITADNGEFSASSVLYIFPQNNLEVISVKIDSDSVSDGDEAKIKPDQDLEVEIEVGNTGSIDFDTVTVTGTIYDLDGEDVEEEVDFSLGDGRKKKSTLVFDVPEQLDDSEYKLEIEIEAEDDDGVIHSQSLAYTLITTKEKHLLKLDASLSTEVMECARQGTIRAEILNLGSNDEDEVRLEIKENSLGINFVKDSIEINEDDEYRTSFALNLEDQDAGNYKFIVSVYRDNKLSEEKTLNLEIQDCSQTKGITQTKSTKSIEQEHQKLITAALAAQQQQQPVIKVEKKQGINEWALVLLIITFILTAGIIIFVIGAAIIKHQKE